jgi:hypothetical protein
MTLKNDSKNIEKRAKYEASKNDIQRNRIVKQLERLAKGDISARKPSVSTLKKYGLYNEKEKTITINEKYKTPKINYVDIEPTTTTQTINIVRKQSIKPVEEYDTNNTIINGSEIKDWVFTVLSSEKMKSNNVRSKKTLDLYANTPRNLFRIYDIKYNENVNILSYFNNVDETLKKIESYDKWKTAATKSKNMSGILFLMQNYPPLEKVISKEIIDKYDTQYKAYGNTGKAEQLQATKNKPIFEWSVIRKATLAHYKYPKQITYQALIILLYNDVIARDDFGCLMAYSPDEVNPTDNFCLIDRKKKTAELILNKYKTSGSYREQKIKLSKDTVNAIFKLHPNDNKEQLFPNKKLGKFISDTFKAVPLLKDEKINIKYLRHSIISSALARIKPSDPNGAKKIEELANKSFHKVSTQNTYLSPLKHADGTPFTVDPNIAKEYDTITTVYNEDIEDDEEEITSKPQPKK